MLEALVPSSEVLQTEVLDRHWLTSLAEAGSAAQMCRLLSGHSSRRLRQEIGSQDQHSQSRAAE
jgi:hypothetical protein